MYHCYHPNAMITKSESGTTQTAPVLTLLLPFSSTIYSLAIKLHMSSNSTDVLPTNLYRKTFNKTKRTQGWDMEPAQAAFVEDLQAPLPVTADAKGIQTVKSRKYRMNALFLNQIEDPKWYVFQVWSEKEGPQNQLRKKTTGTNPNRHSQIHL